MQVKLSKMPDPRTVSSVSLGSLYGGLNLRSDPTEVGSSQSPDMLNMLYKEGVLRPRGGQETVASGTTATRDVWFYKGLYRGLTVYVDGTSIRYFDPEASEISVKTVEGITLPPTGHGDFFPFDEYLYYKAKDIYLRLNENGGVITGEELLWTSGGTVKNAEEVYTPIISINRSADGSGGDSYQPENRINPKKSVWFDVDDSSYDYYLPVSGCRVEKVQVEDDAVDTRDTSTRTFLVGGRQVTICNEELEEDSGQYTYLKFSAPLYVDETGWNTESWTNTSSTGGNYLTNVVYSTFPIEANETMTFKNGKVFRRADTSGLEATQTQTFLERALEKCPYSDYSDYFVLDNGKWMNVFIFGYEGSTDGNTDTTNIPGYEFLVSYNSTTTEMVLRNYYQIQYEYATQKFTTDDYTGRTDTGWHYAKNVAYSTFDMIVGGSLTNSLSGASYEPTYALKKGVNSSNPNQLWSYSLESLAEEVAGCSSSDLIWTAENNQIWTYHFRNGSAFCVTKYDEKLKWFQAQGMTQVTIPKRSPMSAELEVVSDPGQYGYYVKNITYAAEDIVWNYHAPGDSIVSASSGDVPEEYRSYVEIALYRARRDYPDANITGNYAVAVSKDGTYITVYVDTGMELTGYDLDTGEFKAKGFIAEAFHESDETNLLIDLSVPLLKSNRLKVTYRKENQEAMEAILSCKYAAGFGGSDAVAVVLGGCEAQPNAVFWSGNGSSGVDPTYFPMDQYNLCGAYQDPVTGFGKQQSVLIIFQEHHVSRASYSITEISERKYIDLTLSTIHSEKGCDRPWTMAVCGNNLVWLNSHYGALYLSDTSAAYENNVLGISKNVDGSDQRPGLLQSLKNTEGAAVCTDGDRYYVFLGDELYIWDYSLGTVSEGIYSLSWTRHKGFDLRAVQSSGRIIWGLNAYGRLSRFSDNLDTDFGEKISCYYTTPTQTFGGYYRKRDVTEVILAVGSETEDLRADFGGEGRTYGVNMHPEYSGNNPKPVIIKPRGIHVGHFWVRVSGEKLCLHEVTICYVSGGKRK